VDGLWLLGRLHPVVCQPSPTLTFFAHSMVQVSTAKAPVLEYGAVVKVLWLPQSPPDSGLRQVAAPLPMGTSSGGGALAPMVPSPAASVATVSPSAPAGREESPPMKISSPADEGGHAAGGVVVPKRIQGSVCCAVYRLASPAATAAALGLPARPRVPPQPRGCMPSGGCGKKAGALDHGSAPRRCLGESLRRLNSRKSLLIFTQY